jgi:hypothetical protein
VREPTTYRAKRFIEANRKSPIVYGSVLTDPRNCDEHGIPISKGCYYRLASGETFKLNVEDCRAVGFPRWNF